MNRSIEFSPDEYYHLYARGIEKRKIFSDSSDYRRFLMLLYVANGTEAIHLSDYKLKQPIRIFSLPKGKTLVDIGAYCLMPNHWHLLVRSKSGSGISLFVQKLLTGYSMYFNKKNDRTGGLFQRPFKAKIVDDDRYMRYLFAYIHLNPIKIADPDGWGGKKIKNKEKASDFLEKYRFSSYQFYQGQKRPEDSILEISEFPKYFVGEADFGRFLNEWINFDDIDISPTVKVSP